MATPRRRHLRVAFHLHRTVHPRTDPLAVRQEGHWLREPRHVTDLIQYRFTTLIRSVSVTLSVLLDET